MTNTHVSEEETQRLIAEAHEAHRREIDALHILHQRTKIAVEEILATDAFNRPSLQAILSALLSRLEDETIRTLFYQPALQAAQSRPHTKPRAAQSRTPNTNGTSRTQQVHPKQPHQPMGFQISKT